MGGDAGERIVLFRTSVIRKVALSVLLQKQQDWGIASLVVPDLGEKSRIKLVSVSDMLMARHVEVIRRCTSRNTVSLKLA